MIRFVFLIALFSTFEQCLMYEYNEIKQWIGNRNTNATIDSRYWDDLVTIGSFTFNGSMTHAVAIPSVKYGLDECELIYPLDKLPTSVSDNLYNTTEEGECVDEKLLKKIDRVFWLDPRNWALYLSVFESSEAIPHIQRIPCNHDQVRIPNNTNTFIILPPNPIKLSEIEFGGMYIFPFSLIKKIMKNEYFARHFIVKSNLDVADILNISGGSFCEDSTGCECGTDIYEEEICAFVKDDCAKNLPCEKPIQPIGHCCSICGSAVLVSFDKNRFLYNRLEPLVQNFVKNQSDRLKYEVHMHISKVRKNYIQIVLLPKYEYTEDLLDLTMGLVKLLNKATDLGIEGCLPSDAGKPKGDQWSWSNIFVGLAIASIMVVVSVYVNNKLKLIDNAASFCKGWNSTKFKDDENFPTKSTESKEEEIVNHPEETEKISSETVSMIHHKNETNFIHITDKEI